MVEYSLIFSTLLKLQIVNFFLSRIAKAIYGKSSAKAKDWFKKYRSILKKQDQGVIKLIHSVDFYPGSQKKTKVFC